jgi:hypothetical protein
MPNIHLDTALNAWGRDDFQDLLRREIERLPHHLLPLQQALRHSSQVSDEPFQAMILRVEETDDHIRARASLFYSGIIAGCSCADDPTPLDTIPENCLVEVRLDKRDAKAQFILLLESE